jgi:hypothetical protein
VEVSVSYYEIYNEKVYDLLASQSQGLTPQQQQQLLPQQPQQQHAGATDAPVSCRVREHPNEGAYVENLTRRPFESYEQVAAILEEGNRRRAVASTQMNSSSSRSHAVFTVYLNQQLVPINNSSSNSNSNSSSGASSTSGSTGSRAAMLIERKSKVCLVDLAGSERASLTGVIGDRLNEANNINRSLSTLGDVIKALSSAKAISAGKDMKFVPYRNSVLTWLLKDSLGGNSKSTMLAAVSPSENSYNESMSTLRYVERAKLIMTCAVINESSTDPALVAHLQRQVQILQESLATMSKKHAFLEKELRSQKTLSTASSSSSSSTKGDADSGAKTAALQTEVDRLNEIVRQKEKVSYLVDFMIIAASKHGMKSLQSIRSSMTTRACSPTATWEALESDLNRW